MNLEADPFSVNAYLPAAMHEPVCGTYCHGRVRRHVRSWRKPLLDGQATALTQKAIELALTGDMAALRLCLDRILPPRKDSPVAFDLPEMKTLNDAVPAMGALVKAVGQGDLTPTEAGELTKMVQAFAKIIETAELEERVRILEEAINK